MLRAPSKCTRLAIALSAAVVAVAHLSPKSAFAYEERIAVLIGIGDYSEGRNKGIFGDLPVVANDLDAVGNALENLGFDDIRIYSDQRRPRHSRFEYRPLVPHGQASSAVSATDVDRVINPLLLKLHENGKNILLLIYFSGHGGVFGKTERVLALPESERIAPTTYYQVRRLLNSMADYAPNASKMLVVDACADELGIKSSVAGTRQDDDLPTFLFSSRPGEASYYDKGLGLSVFTHYLVEALARAEELRLGEAEGKIDSGGIKRYVQDQVPKHPTAEQKKLQGEQSGPRVQHPTGSDGQPLVLAEYQVKPKPPALRPEDVEKENYQRNLRERNYGSTR